MAIGSGPRSHSPRPSGPFRGAAWPGRPAAPGPLRAGDLTTRDFPVSRCGVGGAEPGGGPLREPGREGEWGPRGGLRVPRPGWWGGARRAGTRGPGPIVVGSGGSVTPGAGPGGRGRGNQETPRLRRWRQQVLGFRTPGTCAKSRPPPPLGGCSLAARVIYCSPIGPAGLSEFGRSQPRRRESWDRPAGEGASVELGQDKEKREPRGWRWQEKRNRNARRKPERRRVARRRTEQIGGHGVPPLRTVSGS